MSSGWPGFDPWKVVEMLRRLTAGLIVSVFAVAAGAGPALARDCVNTQRSGSGGIVGTYYVATDMFIESNAPGNPAFVKIVFPDGSSVYLFIHSGGKNHHYVVPGAKDCDGKGLDNLEVCFGG